MALNDNIKKFREEKNLTQQQLADKLYVSRQTVCRWENGSRCPDLITAKKLALELDVSMDELISDEDVNDMQVNYGIWKSERIKDKKHLQTLQKKILDFIQIVGAVFLAITILLRVQLVLTTATIYYYGIDTKTYEPKVTKLAYSQTDDCFYIDNEVHDCHIKAFEKEVVKEALYLKHNAQ